MLEATKNLLLGNLRVDMLKFELNKIRRGRGSPVVKQGNPSYAAVSLSDVRIPLLWRPRDHMQVGSRKSGLMYSDSLTRACAGYRRQS